jgi:hypothetical protein
LRHVPCKSRTAGNKQHPRYAIAVSNTFRLLRFPDVLLQMPRHRAIAIHGGCVLLALVALSCGCTRAKYHKAADREANMLVTQKSENPRWAINNFNIEYDPRSRYFDPSNTDRNPMPPDDPWSHVFMHRVNNMRGFPYWHRNGNLSELENPIWKQQLGGYVNCNENGALKLDLDTSLRLFYIHSPDYRLQLETVYLSALDVSTERFRFVTQYFGETGPTYLHAGKLRSGTGSTIDQLTVHNTGQFQKKLAAGGTLLVGFANSFVWQFAGHNSNNTNTLLNFNLVQPLLRAGGRAVVMEQLTLAERTLLANLRAMQRYRQGVFTNVAVGDVNGVAGPQRVGGFFGGTGLTGFTGQSGGFGTVAAATNLGRTLGGPGGAGGGGGAGFAGGGAGVVGGFAGLLQQLQQIRNTQATLALEFRTLDLLEANLKAGLIDIAQVDLFRQNIETERATLLQSQVALDNAVDTFLRVTIGLPPNLPVELDDSMIQQFRLLEPRTAEVQAEIADLVDALGKEPGDPTVERLRQTFDQLARLRRSVAERFDAVRIDMQRMEQVVPTREQLVEATERPRLAAERKDLVESLKELAQRFKNGETDVEQLRNSLTQANRGKMADTLVATANGLMGLVQELSLVQARARLESVTVDPIQLSSEDALEIARRWRTDWMNNRAAVVDTWRLITFNANALRGNVSITFNGDLGTVGNNPVRFRNTNSDISVGMQIDPPFTRRLERNNYRQSLIDYQQDRRTLIRFEDNINQTLRQDLRTLRILQQNLEIQRRAVAIAIRRVDQTREVLNEPPAPVQPGQPAVQLGPTAALNLLTALSDLRNAQNNFLSVWLNYYSERMQLMRDLGVMEVDNDGNWVDKPLDATIYDLEEIDATPPPVPKEWLLNLGFLPEEMKLILEMPGQSVPGEVVQPRTELPSPDSPSNPDNSLRPNLIPRNEEIPIPKLNNPDLGQPKK